MRQELYINGLAADTADGLSMPLNFQIADIKEPENRKSNFSKTIRLPGTKRNNAILTNIFEISKEVLSDDLGVNFNPDFNPNLKANALLFVDTFLQFEGFMRLRSVTLTDYGDDYKVTYNVELFGNIANIFQSIGKKGLTEYDFSEWDHDYIKANQVDSWDTRVVKDGAPFVNFSGAPETGFVNGAPTGEGYVYPIINYAWTNLFSYRVDKLFPCIYEKTVLDKIFATEGFTYTSTFLNSSEFKKKVLPFNGELIQITPAQIAQRKFRAELTSQLNETTDIIYTIPFGFPPDGGTHIGTNQIQPVIFDDDSTGLNFDTGGNYDNTTGIYTVPATGSYRFSSEALMTWTINPPPTTGSTQGFMVVKLELINQTTGALLGGATFNTGTSGSTTLSFTSGTFTLQQGDEIVIRALVESTSLKFRVSPLGAVLTDPATIDWTVEPTAFFLNEVIQVPVNEGDEMLMNSVIPPMEAKEWLLGIIREYNLYLQPDPQDEKNLIIEPLVDFYANNQTKEMTKKLDTDRPIEVKTVAEIDAKRMLFKYQDGEDFDNKRWRETYGEAYGTHLEEVKNDFVKNEKIFQLPFDPPMMVGNLTNDMVVMRIAKEEPVGSGTLLSFTGKPRSVHYGGVLPVGGTWSYISTLAGTTNESTYPYAGHLDHPITPSLDLLFEVPTEVYFGTASGIGANYTDNNLYNRFYKQFIEEVTSKDSKIVEAYFHLTPLDIFELDFADFWHVDNAIYRLNKIIDYDPSRGESTKVELTKLITGVPFTPQTIELVGGGGGALRSASAPSIMDGGIDAVKTKDKLTPYTKTDGGEDEVLSLKQTGNIRLTDGGQLTDS